MPGRLEFDELCSAIIYYLREDFYAHTHTFTHRLMQSCRQLEAGAMAEQSCQGAGTAPGAGNAQSTAPAHCNPPRDLPEAKRAMLDSSPSSMPLLCLFQA